MSLSIKHLHFGYSKDREIVHGISCEIPDRELVTVLGPNGCGKTTFVKCINRIHTPWSGQILLGGKDLSASPHSDIAKKVGYVPQVVSGSMSGTVIDYILLGRRQYLNWKLRECDLLAVMEVLDKLHIREFANRDFETLSGGQRQKVVVARALLQAPEMYIFDEPTSNLDLKNQIEIMELARGIVDQDGKTVVMVVHDLNMALHYSDRIILMSDGHIVAQGTPKEVLTPENIRAVYDIGVRLEECGYVNPFPDEH